jgi:hypothetical protein
VIEGSDCRTGGEGPHAFLDEPTNVARGLTHWMARQQADAFTLRPLNMDVVR